MFQFTGLKVEKLGDVINLELFYGRLAIMPCFPGISTNLHAVNFIV